MDTIPIESILFLGYKTTKYRKHLDKNNTYASYNRVKLRPYTAKESIFYHVHANVTTEFVHLSYHISQVTEFTNVYAFGYVNLESTMATCFRVNR